MYDLLRQQMTDLIMRACFIVFVRFMLVMPEKQYYNCKKYEHSTTESVTGKFPLCYNRIDKYHIKSKYTYDVKYNIALK